MLCLSHIQYLPCIKAAHFANDALGWRLSHVFLVTAGSLLGITRVIHHALFIAVGFMLKHVETNPAT